MDQARQDHAYTILETLHRSRLHTVYHAKHYVSQEHVVIKTIDAHWKSDPMLARQLRYEAELGLRLNNRHIRRTRGVFEEDGRVYVVSDYIDGKALSGILGGVGISLASELVKHWLEGLLDALDYAHSQGIVHANVNPANIIIDQDGEPVLFNFGKTLKAWMNEDALQQDIHSVLFLAPEVFLGHRPDPRSDIYSIGVLAYLMLCGKLPWHVDKNVSAQSQKQTSLRQPVIDPEILGRAIPRWLYTVIHKCLIIDPNRRFQSVSELREALNAQTDLPLDQIHSGPAPSDNLPPREEQFSKFAPLPQTGQPETPGSISLDFSQAQPEKVQPPHRPQPVPPPKKEAVKPIEVPKAEDTVNPELKRWGRIMAIASLLVLVFAIIKYSFFNNKPAFRDKQDIESDEEGPLMEPVANVAIKMVLVQGDSTVIGTVSPDADDDEAPPVKLRVPDFWISPYEITNEQWAMVYPEHFYNLKDKDLPVTNISFLEVLEYCNEKSYKDGFDPCYDFQSGYVCDFSANGYRLPTEAEWEFAAKERKSSGFDPYSGSDDPDKAGWHSENSDGKLREVGKKRANALGLHDMSGNAYEWVWNWYGPYSSRGKPFEGPSKGTDRVIRGGSYSHDVKAMRVTNRSYIKQFAKSPYLGFRVARGNR